MATIAETKAALEKWAPVMIFDVVLKDGTPRYWAKQAVTFAGNPYIAIVLEHSELRIEGNGIYGVDAVTQISLTLNNADANLNSLIAPANWQGGTIQPRFIFVAPNGTTTTDAIVYPKFLIDLPTATWPKIEFTAHNKWNLARKMLPASLVTKKDRYPFPDTAAERTAAGSDPSSEFFASGYDPDTGKGNMKAGGGYYTRADYNGTREKLREIGLEVRFGGFGLVPPTVVGTPKKGERADYIGNANEAKYGQAVPLVFGTCRIQPIVLDTGFPSGVGGWNGARLSHYLLSDGVTFGPEASMGIEDVLNVFIPDNAKYQKIPETSNEPQTSGAWSFQGGYYGSQKAPASSKYRNIDQSIDFPTPVGEFTNRDLYSGLAYLEIGFPKELSGQDGIGPKLEAIVKGLKVETWESTGTLSDWLWTDNPVWIFVHLLKLLRWSTADMDKPAIYQAAAYCDEIVAASGKKRFRCNLALTQQTRAADVLRGIRNNCRMYTAFAADGKLQLKIAQNVAGEGGLAFALDNTNIMRGNDGRLLVEKFHRSVFEVANVFTVAFQNEENFYNTDSFSRVDVRNVNQIDEKITADSIFPILGIPSFDQAERQMEWARQEQITLNEYYRVTCSLSLIEAKVGQVGTITEARHALINQQVRIRAMAPGPDAGTIELVLQKHSDGAYTDESVETPFNRARADSSYTPRSVGGKNASSPAPVLTEVTVADPINADTSVRRIKVEFKPPEATFEGSFSRATKIRDVVVATSGGSIPGGQVLFVEVAPIKALVRGLASEYLMVNVPSGGNLNSFTFTCELPPEADQYIAYVGNFPGQTYEQTVAASPGTVPFTITITNLNRNFGSIPPDPAFDHVHIFYKYNSSPNVLRDGGRTSAPTESVLEFEPEAPAAEDTQVTVYVSSANAAEDDFYPIEVSPKATLTLTYENGPAQGWTATLMPGPTPSSVVAKFTRPTVNGKRLFWVAAQVKDSGTGAWRELDDNAGAAVTYYDGSAISHESIGGLKIKKDPGQPVGFGTAKVDDLMMLDVAGGSFDRDRCQWGTVEKFLDDLGAETTAANARYIALTGGLFRPQTTQDLRMKIVKPPHTWDTEGYLGNLTNESINGGVFFEWVGDREGNEFILAPVEIGRDIASVDVRFWIENDYCRSGGQGTHSTNAVRVRAARDDVIPGPVVALNVKGANGEFVAKWQDPTTGAATLDDTAIQYTTDSGFTLNGSGSPAKGFGRRNDLKGLDPGKTYYWRVAVHNKSDKQSDASTEAQLGPTGWGPWTAFGAPTAVSSGTGAGAPSDSVIPGPVESLSVTGANGVFKAEWLPPTTGNLTIDTYAEEYRTDAAFTQGGDLIQIGNILAAQGTAPGLTYYFRFAAHNQSGLTSDSSTYDSLGPTGWGPWTNAPANPVSSGLLATPEELVFNGGFELDDGTGQPASWIKFEEAAAGWVTAIDTVREIEGKNCFLIGNPSGGQVGFASKAFAVRGEEFLDFSIWVHRVGGPNQGMHFIAFFHPDNPDFLRFDTGVEYEAFWSAHDPPLGVWTQYQKRTKVPTGMGWCRIGLYNYGTATNTNYYYDDVQCLRVISGNEIDDNTIPPNRFTGAARTEFVETFDEPIGTFWNQQTYGTVTYPSQGVDGGKVLQGEGQDGFFTDEMLIPYDPRKLYRMTVRARRTATADAAKQTFYVGLGSFNQSRAKISDVFVTANNVNASAWTLNQWQEFTGWFKGVSTSGSTGVFGPAPDAANPTPLDQGTVYIAPEFYLNWVSGAPAGNVMQIDDIRIEIFDEQRYTSAAPNGTFSTPLTYRVIYPFSGDNNSSIVSLFWDYTQGLVKAQQFAITIYDGVATWVHRVRALPGQGALRHLVNIGRVIYNRTLYCSIVPEAVGFGGQVPGTGASWPNILPNSNQGSDPGGWTLVGELDWAGGNIWFDSDQYRNDRPPTNAPGAGFTVTWSHTGSGGSRAVISGFPTYTQGANIATHFAVLLRYPAGTIVLGQDMVVCYIGIAGGVPSSYSIPLAIPDDVQGVSVGVAALAECKHGRIFNTTFQQIDRGGSGSSGSLAVNAIWLQCVNTPSDGLGRRILIGHTSGGDAIRTYGDGIHCHEGGGTERAWIGGNSSAAYLSNSSAYAGAFFIQQSTGNPNFGFNTYAWDTSAGNVVYFKNVTGGFSVPPTEGGLLYSGGGAGIWRSTSGTYTTFGAAGPHCAKCGYDFWLVAGCNSEWSAYLAVCGWCRAVYKKGPKTAFHLLTEEQKSEIIGKTNVFKMLSGGMASAEAAKPRRSLRRRDTRPTGKSTQTRLRSARRRSLRLRHKNSTT